MEAELLQRLWSIVFRLSPEQPVATEWLLGFAPLDFINSLRERRRLSLSDAVDMAQKTGICRSALTDTIDRLKNEWNSLTAVAKHDIGRLAANPAYIEFLAWVPELTPDEKEDLRIQWHVADALYAQRKTRVLEALEKAGYDDAHRSLHFMRHLFPDLMAEVGKILQQLARTHMEIDLAVVTLEVGGSRYKYFNKIAGRARADVTSVLCRFQDTVRDLDKLFASVPNGARIAELEGLFENMLRNPLEAVFDSISTLQPNPELLKEVQEIIAGESTVRHITLTGNTIIASQIGGVGNTMQSYGQQINATTAVSEEERQLKQLLVDLRKGIEASADLSPFQKKSSLGDVDMLTVELSKPADQQDDASIKGFWSRLKDTVSISSGLVTIATAIGKVLNIYEGGLN